jgi:hypothetical protein
MLTTAKSSSDAADAHTDVQRSETLLKTGALQGAIFNSANFYQLGVNAYVVKPMKFQDFLEAVRQVGAFWGVINEVPPGSVPRIVSTGS